MGSDLSVESSTGWAVRHPEYPEGTKWEAVGPARTIHDFSPHHFPVQEDEYNFIEMHPSSGHTNDTSINLQWDPFISTGEKPVIRMIVWQKGKEGLEDRIYLLKDGPVEISNTSGEKYLVRIGISDYETGRIPGKFEMREVRQVTQKGPEPEYYI